MPPPLLERLALEFPRVLVLVVFVVVVFVIGPVPAADDLELQAEQHAHGRFDGAHLDGAQQQQQHIHKLKLVHLAWRVRIDQHLNVRRPFEQLSAAVMLNAGLAPLFDFARSS